MSDSKTVAKKTAQPKPIRTQKYDERALRIVEMSLRVWGEDRAIGVLYRCEQRIKYTRAYRLPPGSKSLETAIFYLMAMQGWTSPC